jgi:dienelactone hydrolase
MRIPSSVTSRLLGPAASSFDRAVIRAATWRTRRAHARAEGLSHAERVERLAEIRDAYRDPAFITSPELFFSPPEPIHPLCVRVRDLPGHDPAGGVFDASWPSNFTPYLGTFAEQYLAYEHNRTAHARLFLSGKPRPVVIAIHGYLGGQYAIEERAFPIRWMIKRGFDVALITLPFHALRGRGDKAAAPPFPGSDPRFTIEGSRQAVHDIRGLMGYLRGRGAPSVGVMGMSLGGYTAALLATLEASLSFAVPIIPLASFADFALEQGRLGQGADALVQYRAFDEAIRVASPLARPSLLPKERVLILAASHDQITPARHAERLALHSGGRLVVFPGGHLLQFGRADAFREIGRFWRQNGLLGS